MTNALVNRLDPTTAQQKKGLTGMLSKVKTVSGFLSEAISALKDNAVTKAIGEALPWAMEAAEPIAEAVPPVKFVAAVLDALVGEPDPEALAYLACTVAYQRSIEQAANELPTPTNKKVQDNVEWALDAQREAEGDEFQLKGVTFSGLSRLLFVDQAEEFLLGFARVVGYRDRECEDLAREVRVRFPTNLKLLLSHGKTRKRFEPLTQYLELGGGEEELVQEALLAHAEYQRRLFEEERVLGGEPFSLANIYVDLDCGALTWKDFHGMKDRETGERCNPDAFKTKFGGRHPLLPTVMGLLENPEFRDAVVIQGVAGSGKSTFTLRLCAELVRRGFRPIRVRLRDVTFDRHPRDSLPRAVRLTGEGEERYGLPEPEHMFREGKIFRERARFGQAMICPYVLILDGWDEISISADAGFRKRVTEFLEKVRAEYLDRDPLVRVVVTGRPTADVTHESSGFFDDRTRVLTIRPLAPVALELLVDGISGAVEQHPLGWVDEFTKWLPPDPKVRQLLVERYAKGFEKAEQDEKDQRQDPVARSSESLPIVGLPLLAHMTIRLLAGQLEDVDELLRAPTTLYRRLTDLTCSTAATHPAAEISRGDRQRIKGSKLRGLLHLTATAMTIEGEDSISQEHLRVRIRRLGEQSKLGGHSLSEFADSAVKGFPISKLMVSYFFKGGRNELGCEFAHKSFREYLFAEALVEVLKDYGRGDKEAVGKRSSWWSDFDSNDPRYRLSRALGPRLSAQWLTTEVASHVDELLAWEIGRAQSPVKRRGGRATESLTVEQWCRVREGISSVWEWWAEGVHMRPQVEEGELGQPQWLSNSLYANKLVELRYPVKPDAKNGLPAPVRLVTIDAQLGDGLFRLCAKVHSLMLNEEFLHGEGEWRVDETWWNQYQANLYFADSRCMVFRPGGKPHKSYFSNFCSRISGAGWRPEGDFPVGIDLDGVDFRGAHLSGVYLEGTLLSGALLGGADFRGAHLSGADLSGADLRRADFGFASLISCSCVGVDLSGVNLSGADLRTIDLSGANLSGANLRGANLRNALLDDALLRDADLRDVDLRGARFSNAQISEAQIDEEDLLFVNRISEFECQDEILDIEGLAVFEGVESD